MYIYTVVGATNLHLEQESKRLIETEAVALGLPTEAHQVCLVQQIRMGGMHL